MNWITVAWPMVASACITLGLLNLAIGLAHPPRAARLLFSLNAFAVASFCGIELAITRVDNPADAKVLLVWGDVAFVAIVASLTAFIWVFFGSGNKWLALATVVLHIVALVFDFVPGSLLIYQEITGVRTLETFGGATYNVVEGVPNPLNAILYLGILLLLVFVVDASVRLWRRGGRQRAAVVGGAVTFFIVVSGVEGALIESGIVRLPYMISWAYLGMLLAMGYELLHDVVVAGQLGRQLQEGERRLDLASAAARLGMWNWDITRDTIWATSRTRLLFGFSESESLSLARFMSALHPSDRDDVRQAIENSLNADRDYEVEYRVQLPDGQTRWLEAHGRVDRDPQGKPILMRGVVLDVTGRKLAEIQAERDRTALRHLTRISMLGQLSASIAHQLNQPLTAILSNAEAAQRMLQHEPVDLAALREISDDIVSEDLRAVEVIRGLRALYKRGEAQLRPLDFNLLVRETLDLVRMDLLTRHVTPVADLFPSLPLVEGDPVQLQQVLLNLILNGAEAMTQVDEGERTLTIRTESVDSVAVVSVADRGTGIDPDNLTRVFEPFWSTKPGGMGVGLAVCQSIVAAHRGSLTVDNTPEGGAKFCVTLPTRGGA